MDYKRIQVLLLAFFIVFDFYLLHMLFLRVESTDSGTPSQVTENIESSLTSRGITFQSFSNKKETKQIIQSDQSNFLEDHLDQLDHQTVRMDKETLVGTFDEPVDLGLGLDNQSSGLDEDQYRQLYLNFLSKADWFINGDLYKSYWYLPSDRLLVLRMTSLDGDVIVDGSADLRLYFDENYKLVSYTQTYQEGISQTDTQYKTLSEKEAMEILGRRVETAIPDNSTIISSRLAYFKSSSVDGLNVYSPAWEFIYSRSDGSLRVVMVDAVRGKVVERSQLVSS